MLVKYLLASFFAFLLIVLQFSYILKASVALSHPRRTLTSCIASGKGGKLPGSNRDCQNGEGPICSQAEPCTPCDKPDSLSCAKCSPSNLGTCGFVVGYGPYCSVAGQVRPCTLCCST